MVEYNGARLRPIERDISYEDIDGSPYHSDKLISGLVITLKGDTLVRFMRYDSYTEKMEYVQDDQLLVLNNPEATNLIRLNNMEYVYRIFDYADKSYSGFLTRLADGECELLRRDWVEFEEEEPGQTPYHKVKPDRFTKKGPAYFYSCNGGRPVFFKGSQSDLEELTGDRIAESRRFIKQEKLKLRKEEDMIRLFNFLNNKK